MFNCIGLFQYLLISPVRRCTIYVLSFYFVMPMPVEKTFIHEVCLEQSNIHKRYKVVLNSKWQRQQTFFSLIF